MILYTKICGVTFNNEGDNTQNRQYIIRQLYRNEELEPNTVLTLKCEPFNKYDSHAVAVFAPDGRQLGYLSKELAYPVFENINKGITYKVTVSSVTGGDINSNYGVNIKLEF